MRIINLVTRAVEMLLEWHKKFGVPVSLVPCIPPRDRRDLRASLITEEAAEFDLASTAGDITEAADALADLLYVIYGAALEWGIDVDAVLEEVHRSNMTKVWPDGTIHMRDDGKILKPPTYSPADIRKVLGLQK
jgi:predicted HAD superfamily Cof-like phosphohydrolase